MKTTHRQYGEIVSVLALITAAGCLWPRQYDIFGEIYLLAVFALSLRVGRLAALFAAVASAVGWNYFMLPPAFAFAPLRPGQTLLIGIYFLAAVIGGQLAAARVGRERARLLARSEELHQALFNGLAHEIKTPLAVLRSALDEMRARGGEPSPALLVESGRAVARLDHVVENLINHTRLESGVLQPKMDWCDPLDLIRSARRSQADRLGLRAIDVRVPPGLPLFFADAALMEQVIANLLLNAALYTPPAAAIAVEGGSDAPNRKVFVRVRDSGPGIPPELQERLFQRFVRGAGVRAGGLGLGLAVARSFMRAQGGELTLASAPGRGAAFTAWLPAPELTDLPP
ncbi:MAG TPA: ATP-binding protein [Opitutaceae bacterium]|jgi:two-component system sensor histidine kinase KdpD|nr:ATP-binding protein [Opitutaceae bacterium]